MKNGPWEFVDREHCINTKWACWKKLFLSVLDKHAPVRERRIRQKSSVPWLTKHIKQLMHGKDLLKIKAISSSSLNDWKAYTMSIKRVTKFFEGTKRSLF